METKRPTFFPLLGERAGVRAGIFLLLISLPVLSAPQIAWLARYNNGITNGTHKPVAMLLDNAGNILVAGSSQNAQSNLDYVVLKYAPNGTQLWVARYDSGGGTNDEVRGMAADSAGNVYVTGTSLTVKFGSTGTHAWTALYAGRAIAADDYHAYVTGFSTSSYATVKLSGPAGTNVWLRTYTYLDGPDLSQVVAVDTRSNVYVSGSITCYSFRNLRYENWISLKYDANGNEVWTPNPFPDGCINTKINVKGLRVGFDGNVYITANLISPSRIFVTRKLNSSGSVQWEYALETADGNGVNAMGLSSDAFVYLTGWIPLFSYPDSRYATVKLGTNGTGLWTNFYGDSILGIHYAMAIAVDAAGASYVAGVSPGSGTGNDWATIKYDNNGGELWVQRYDGPAHGNDEAVAIAVDNAGAVYVTGYHTVPGGGTEIVTIKYAELQNIQRQTNCSIRLQFFAPAGQSYAFQVSSNLTAWEPLATVLADSNGIATFDDTNAIFYPQRFYRGVSP